MLACLIMRRRAYPLTSSRSAVCVGPRQARLRLCQDGRVPTSLSPAITHHDVESTYAIIKPHIRLTPVIQLSAADFGLASVPLVLKLEHLQHAGSFKTRGAFANLLLREIPAAGVVAPSGGTHGRAGASA